MTFKINNKVVGPVAFGLMGFTIRPQQTPYSQALKTMKAALDNGANFWNGGDFYGPPNANSLQLLNHYFTQYPEDKERVVLSIKGAFSFHPIGPDNSPENIRKGIDTCLEVLNGKVFVDIWQPSRADPKVEIETTIRAISEYVKAGKIGGIGLSEVNASNIRRAHAVHPITAVEVELSLFTTDALTNGVASTCAELGITLLGYAPLSTGFLTGEFKKFEDIPENDLRRTLPRFQPDLFHENLRIVEEVKKIAERKNCTMAQIAIAWVKSLNSKPGMPRIIPLPGTTSVARVEENTKEVLLDAEEVAQIDEILARFPVQGHRWPAFLQPFEDA
ncbi:putative aldo-keto reductase-2 [Coleophoma crateriformis]|uniref:Putative aldo-keto reductase-2 n=1 Tax=Coleophoma crateriformis TaxID=565419 RepID=A0A3D8RCI8_9HELO|nr:putative aldo-keto reductase-2 [Coleophoma crateriformis]